jgi:hypothetical protein
LKVHLLQQHCLQELLLLGRWLQELLPWLCCLQELLLLLGC